MNYINGILFILILGLKQSNNNIKEEIKKKGLSNYFEDFYTYSKDFETKKVKG